MTQDTGPVAVLGLGSMGSSLAGRLLDQGSRSGGTGRPTAPNR
ncbi:hypothetical protein [Streptomyces clavuligerus]|nr:hypothetical protein [Streptomyces clavuligerus]